MSDTVSSIEILLRAEDLRYKLKESLFAVAGKPITKSTREEFTEMANKILKLQLAKNLVNGLEPYLRTQGKHLVVWEIPQDVFVKDFKQFNFDVLELLYDKITVITIKGNVVITGYY